MQRSSKLALVAAIAAVSVTAQAGTLTPSNALYEIKVERTWNESTHPLAWPGDAAHFSPGIGATHGASYRLFAAGAIATPGLETLSQKGKTMPFDREIAGAQDQGAVGSVFMLSPVRISGGEVSAQFEADDEHPMVSFAQMVAPSPDWFTGVTAVSLKRDGRWIDAETLPLYAWDSGTNAATSYTAMKIAQEPFVPTMLNQAPMFARDGKLVPVGKVTLRKVR